MLHMHGDYQRHGNGRIGDVEVDVNLDYEERWVH